MLKKVSLLSVLFGSLSLMNTAVANEFSWSSSAPSSNSIVYPEYSAPAPNDLLKSKYDDFKSLAATMEKHKVGTIIRDCYVCPELVVIPPGEFQRGNQIVKIHYPIAVGRFEVTWAEWKEVVRDIIDEYHNFPVDKKRFVSDTGREPKTNITHEEVKIYIEKLNKHSGQNYRLLTSAEWEYAARGGTVTDYYTGNSITKKQANFDNDRAMRVGSFPPNPFGLYDMAGNVEEWVEDCGHPKNPILPTDGSAVLNCEGDYHVVRDGSYNSEAYQLESSYYFSWGRGKNIISIREYDRGFRIVKDLR